MSVFVCKNGGTYRIRVRVNEYNKLEKVIDNVSNFNGHVICDVIVPRDQLIIPTVASQVN